MIIFTWTDNFCDQDQDPLLPKRLGIPGEMNFPYLVNEGQANEAIVYAPDMMAAFRLWSLDINGTDPEPYSIRLMSDNE